MLNVLKIKYNFLKFGNKMIKISIKILRLNKPMTLKAMKLRSKNSPDKKIH